MWVDEALVAHTVWPPDWRAVVRLAGTVPDVWPAALVSAVEMQVEENRERVFARISSGAIQPGGATAELPPCVFIVPVEVITEPWRLGAYLEGIDEWWHLDLLDAIERCLDEP